MVMMMVVAVGLCYFGDDCSDQLEKKREYTPMQRQGVIHDWIGLSLMSESVTTHIIVMGVHITMQQYQCCVLAIANTTTTEFIMHIITMSQTTCVAHQQDDTLTHTQVR